MEIGYFLSSEEQKPTQLISHAQIAERSGFEFIVISDHFHPWVSQQGESSFVWSVLGKLTGGSQQDHVKIVASLSTVWPPARGSANT